jgi:hypothetical protein
MTNGTPFQWNNANFAWNENPYTWDDVAFIESLVRGGKYNPVETLEQDSDKKKRFVKLLCKVQGTEYSKQRQIKDIKITIDDVALVAKEVLGINIKVDM